MDKESAWSVPKGAREIAESYCAEEFMLTTKGQFYREANANVVYVVRSIESI